MSTVEAVAKYYGLTEVPGAGSDKTILSWIQKYFPSITNDEDLPYCSIALREALSPYYEVSDSTPMARSWLHVGAKVEPQFDTVQFGDVVVMWRVSPEVRSGHVTLFFAEHPYNEKLFYGIGFNQNNKCEVSVYDKSRILGYRRLKAK